MSVNWAAVTCTRYVSDMTHVLVYVEVERWTTFCCKSAIYVPEVFRINVCMLLRMFCVLHVLRVILCVAHNINSYSFYAKIRNGTDLGSTWEPRAIKASSKIPRAPRYMFLSKGHVHRFLKTQKTPLTFHRSTEVWSCHLFYCIVISPLVVVVST